MKYSHKLSDAIHVLAYIDVFQHHDLSSRTIARSVESNPSLVRRLLSKLTKAGLLISKPGIAGRKLARPADQITLLNIYSALNGHDLLHVDQKTNPKCIVGGNIQAVLNQTYQKVQLAAEREMRRITLKQIIDEVLARHRERIAKD